jgi:hypothetical protein
VKSERRLVSSLFAHLIVVVSLLIFGAYLFADDAEDRRAGAGVRLFRSLLAADTDIAKKTAEPNHLLVVFYYVDDARRASELAARFVQESKELRGLTVITEIANDAAMPRFVSRVPAGIFIAQAPPRNSLMALVRYGISHRVIVYSPFEGHVELGVLGGLSVEAQVRPFLNQSTLDASQISLKPFFLSVAKVYR